MQLTNQLSKHAAVLCVSDTLCIFVCMVIASYLLIRVTKNLCAPDNYNSELAKSQWRTERDFAGFKPPRNSEAEPNSEIRGK
jgi:hypothetical protein